MKFHGPLIAVANMNQSRHFYEEVLGQQVILDFGANITFEGDFSLQTRLSWAEFIDQPEANISRSANNFELYFEEDRFDGFMERLASFDVELVHETREYPWGQRVVRLYDPDRHIVEVGESMAMVIRRFIAGGLSIEETALRTQFPVEFVIGCMLDPDC